MKSPFARFGALTLCILALAGCGSGGGSDEPPAAPGSLKDAIGRAAADPANDTSINSSASFTVLQSAGLAAVVVNSPPKVNFSVFSGGSVLQGLTTANMSFAIAKLIPGTNGNIDRWENYIYRTETAAAGVGPGGVPALPSAKQATTDAKTPSQLVFNDDGYYTYTFSTDITDITKTNGVVFEPGRTHRVAIQLSYTDGTGQTIRVNPYFDFTLDGNGHSVALTDPSQTRKMTDVSSCNGCHEKLALHGGGRVDTQFCVMCHNPGTTDANSGNVLTLMSMVHKIHSGRLLKSKLDEGLGGEQFVIWGFGNTKHDFAEVGFPQDLRNCTKCHSGSNPATPQGDNWKTRPSKEACLTCHANLPGSAWDTSHKAFADELVGPGSQAKALTNQQCANCHKVGAAIAPERVHFNQNEEHGAKYKMNIDSLTFNDTPDKLGRTVTVKYFLSDPTNGNAAYDLTEGCTAAPPNVCTSNNKFGNLRFYLAYPAMVGQPIAITEFTGSNIGGGSNVAAYLGVNDGNNHYTVNLPIPDDDPATRVAAGTARVVSIGQVKEPLLQVKAPGAPNDPRPEVVPQTLINTVVQNTFMEFAISGPLNPRRTIVATEKCNVCHGALGTTSGSNTLANAFHGGARNIVEACVTCHDANRMSSTVMTNGLAMQESYQFKRMIHGIHGNSRRTFPFTHGNKVTGPFSKQGVLLADGTNPDGSLVPVGTPLAADVENYAAEVAWPGVGINCNVCHVDNSYKVDRGPIGAVISKPAGVTDPKEWLVITPKAATCTACHDSPKAMGHVAAFGGAAFGSATQATGWLTQETCADCHSSGGFKGVDIVHGQK